MVKLLLDGGAEPNKEDEDGQTPLHWAARNGHKDVVQLLVGWAALNKKNVDLRFYTLLYSSYYTLKVSLIGVAHLAFDLPLDGLVLGSFMGSWPVLLVIAVADVVWPSRLL